MGRSVICDNCGQILDVASAYCSRCGSDVLVPATKARLAEEFARAQSQGLAHAAASPLAPPPPPLSPPPLSPPPSPASPPPPPPPRRSAATAATAAATATATVGRATSLAGALTAGAGLPWQTIVGNQAPDLKALLARTGAPLAQQAVRRSLRNPGLALLVTTALDLFVVWVTAGPVAVEEAFPRVAAGAATALLSLLVGSRGGPLRGLAGLSSVVTAGLQVASLASALMAALDTGDVVAVAPMALAMASALTTAVKTAAVAFRGKQ